VSAVAAAGCAKPEAQPHDEHGHAEAEETHAERGPHGGRLFEAEGVRVELSIFEDGTPPEFRAHVSDAEGRALPTDGLTLSVTLDRFGGRRDSLLFRAEPELLRSTSTVDEPHSFTARLHLGHAGKSHEWSYQQTEGRVRLSPEAIAQAGILTERAGPRQIEVRLETPGEIRLNADRVVQVRPRFPGVVLTLPRQLGDRVHAGDVLAVVHSNESLAEYEIVAPLTGTIVARNAAVGEAVAHESILFTLADLSTVWAYFPLYPQFAMQVRMGQKVRIRGQGGDSLQASGRVGYVGPLLEQDTRISYGRAVLDNSSGRWTPGLYVNASITVENVRVSVAVPEAAIVRTSRGPAVFRAAGDEFELQPVVTGRTDGEWTEIVTGLRADDRYVRTQAFLLKAELGKSEATHDH
jgi:cobalt-zinc-cadmium efflux system membrane fusion protein